MAKFAGVFAMFLSLIFVTAECCWAASPESFCSHGQTPNITKDDTIACYSDAGCKSAETMGGDPVRDYDQCSARFALTKGKIIGIITASSAYMKQIKNQGGKCRQL